MFGGNVRSWRKCAQAPRRLLAVRRVFGARRDVGAHSHSSTCAFARSDLPAPRRSHCPALARLYRYMWQRPRAEAELAAKAAVVAENDTPGRAPSPGRRKKI